MRIVSILLFCVLSLGSLTAGNLINKDSVKYDLEISGGGGTTQGQGMNPDGSKAGVAM